MINKVVKWKESGIPYSGVLIQFISIFDVVYGIVMLDDGSFEQVKMEYLKTTLV